MPLHDHFHSPWKDKHNWEAFHSAWVNTIVRHFNGSILPESYRAEPQVHLAMLLERNVYEIRVVDITRNQRLVAVVELVSPGNKDRKEKRNAFVSKCVAYLQQRVGVLIVDVVTERKANFHQALLEYFDQTIGDVPAMDLYVVSYHTRKETENWKLNVWPERLVIDQSLPTMPLWLSEKCAVPVELETSYEETCRVLRMN